jgi:hypothetical protein
MSALLVVPMLLALLADGAALMHLLRVMRAHSGTQWSGKGKLEPIALFLAAIIVGTLLLWGFGFPVVALAVAGLPVIIAIVMFGGVLVIYTFFGGRPN